jgi:hypothetical protein
VFNVFTQSFPVSRKAAKRRKDAYETSLAVLPKLSALARNWCLIFFTQSSKEIARPPMKFPFAAFARLSELG